eukprot:gene845-4117_t
MCALATCLFPANSAITQHQPEGLSTTSRCSVSTQSLLLLPLYSHHFLLLVLVLVHFLLMVIALQLLMSALPSL